MSYFEPIATPSSHLEPDEMDYCELCNNFVVDCECDEGYEEERSDD